MRIFQASGGGGGEGEHGRPRAVRRSRITAHAWPTVWTPPCITGQLQVMRQADDSFAQGLYQTSRKNFARNLRDALEAKDAACAEKVTPHTARRFPWGRHSAKGSTRRRAAPAAWQLEALALCPRVGCQGVCHAPVVTVCDLCDLCACAVVCCRGPQIKRLKAQHEQALAQQRQASLVALQQDAQQQRQEIARQLKEDNRKKLAEVR